MRLRHRFLSLTGGLAMVGALTMALTFALTLAVPAYAASIPQARQNTTHYMGIFHGHKLSAVRAAGTDLVYQGGAVETTPVIYISWWGSQWNTGFSTGGYSSAKAQTYITDFFNNVGGSSWDNITTQYCQGIAAGSTSCGSGGTHITNPAGQLKGTWVDTTSVPTRPTQSQIQSAATRLMNHFGGYNANATYFVFTPHGHSMSGFGTSWCAWHDEPTSGTQMAYAYMPYIPDAGASCGMNFVNGSNDSYGHGYFDGFSIVGGHEYAEATTDTHPERTSTNFGWITNTGSTGEEIGDLCAWASNSSDITLANGNFYATQPLWSNASASCVNSF
jgi:serine protease